MSIVKCNKLITALIFLTLTAFMRSPLTAKERRGATVEVTLSDGNVVKGELLSVREKALIVHEGNSGHSWYLYLDQISQVKVLRRSKLSEGVSVGIGVGLLLSVRNLKKIDRESLVPVFFQKVVSFWPLPITGLGGGLLGALGGIPQKYSLAGGSPQIVRKNLERLARHAREPYCEKPAADKKMTSAPR